MKAWVVAACMWMQYHCSWGWFLIERMHRFIFLLFSGRRVNKQKQALAPSGLSCGQLRLLEEKDIPGAVEFFKQIRKEQLRIALPDSDTFSSTRRFLRHPAFVPMGVFSRGEMTGYAVLRLLVNASATIGVYVPAKYRAKGIGREMVAGLCSTGRDLGFEVFSSIGRSNVASFKAHVSSGKMRLVRQSPKAVVLKAF